MHRGTEIIRAHPQCRAGSLCESLIHRSVVAHDDTQTGPAFAPDEPDFNAWTFTCDDGREAQIRGLQRDP
jgi:hypothetical protein